MVVATTMHNMGQEECNTNLALGIGACGDQKPSTSNGDRRIKKPPVQLHVLFPKEEKHQEEYSVGSGSLSRSRSRSTDEEEEEAAADGGSGGGGGGGGSYLGGTRKKLRLTTAQVALLEDSFREQNILNPVQKRGLADRLNIQPRQVEVWFQNRRARTKLKQTEVDCEYLKKRCDSLSTENRRLKKELQELEAMAGRPGSPLYMHLLKAAKLTMCPSCEQVAAAGVGRISKTSSGAGGIKDQLLSAVNSRILSL